MTATPEILSAIAGAIVGWVLISTVARASGVRDKALIIASTILLWVVFHSGIRELEFSLVAGLTEFFASTYFAVGALVGAVFAGSNGPRPPRQQHY